jgi:hypothetical protein
MSAAPKRAHKKAMFKGKAAMRKGHYSEEEEAETEVAAPPLCVPLVNCEFGSFSVLPAVGVSTPLTHRPLSLEEARPYTVTLYHTCKKGKDKTRTFQNY